VFWLVLAALADDYEIGVGACNFENYKQLKQNVLNQTCDGLPCKFDAETACSYIRQSCNYRYVTTRYVDYYWCNHNDGWVAFGFPILLIVFSLFLVKVLWSTVDEFLNKTMNDMICFLHVPEKLAVVILLSLGSNTPAVGIGMNALIWHDSWRLWIGLNLSIALIYVTGLLGLTFIRFKVQPEEKLAKVSLSFLVVLCIFFSIIVIGDTLSIWAALTLLLLHLIFVCLVWCTTKRDTELNANLLLAVRKNVNTEEMLRHTRQYRRTSKIKSRRKKFKMLDNNVVEVWKAGDGELSIRDLNCLALDDCPSPRGEKHVHHGSKLKRTRTFEMAEYDNKNNNFRAPLLDQTSSGRPVIINRVSSGVTKFLPHRSRRKITDDDFQEYEHEHDIVFELEPHPLLDLCGDEMDCCSRFFLILELPITILRLLTIPETDLITQNIGQRLRNSISLVLGALMITWFGIWEIRGFGIYIIPNDLWLFVFMGSTSMCLAIVVWCCTSSNQIPNRYVHLALQFYAFITSLVWVYELATQIVNICDFFTLCFEYAKGLWLGFMVLGPFMCLPDICDFILSSCDEYNVNVEIDLSSPLMTLLVGLWVPLLFRTIFVGSLVEIQVGGFLPEMCTLLAIAALFLLAVIQTKLYIGNWRPRVGVVLVFIYLLSCFFAVFHDSGLNN